MNTNILATAVIALLIGGIGGYALNAATPMHRMSDGSMMRGDAHSGMHAEMDAMMEALEGKTGDAFDQAFLSEMIVHHEGAVAMAEAALEHAGREEIKTMANAIIAAQKSEIEQMQAWQKSWYGE